MNKISIVTINWNNAKGLEQTIESVLGQTYTNYEYIVIDGASTDGSVEIIEKYKSQLNYALSEPDTGIYNAMNKGIKQSTGDYCYFLNSGDTFASKHTLELIFGQSVYNAPFINGHQINIIEGKQHKAFARNRMLTLYDFYWGTIKHQATFIHRDLFNKYGLYDESLKIISDWKFFLQTIGLHNEQPVYVDIDIVHFLWEGISTNPKWIEIHKKERQAVLDECIPKSIQVDYENLKHLNEYKYISDLMDDNSLFSNIVRGMVKLFK